MRTHRTPTSRNTHRRAAALALACGILPIGIAGAQAVPIDEPSAQGVEVKGVRNPALMPYRKAYDLASGVGQATGNHADLVIRVTSSESHQPMPDLSLRVVGDNTDARVPVSPEGFVDLPLDTAFYADNADIVANKPKKAIEVDIHVVPRLPAGQLRFADILDATSAGQAALTRIVPWYARLVLPSLHGVGLCYPAAGLSVAIGGDVQTTRAATEIDTDPTGVKVFCANFSAKEAGVSRETPLTPPDGWQALYW